MYKKRLVTIAIIVFVIFSVITVSYAFFDNIRKTQTAYKSFRQFTGQENGISVTLIEDEYNSGVDAIGVAEKYIKPYVVYFDYYYRDTNTFSWNHFYRKK